MDEGILPLDNLAINKMATELTLRQRHIDHGIPLPSVDSKDWKGNMRLSLNL